MGAFDIIRRWGAWLVIAAAIGVAAYWGYQHTQPPKVIRLATAGKTGYYYKFGTILKEYVEKNTDYQVEVLVTKGTVDNRSRLLSGEADLAIVQNGAIPMDNLAAVAPLWDDFIQVIVRMDSSIRSFSDMVGRGVAIGQVGSGERVGATHILEHYGIVPEDLRFNSSHFSEMETNPEIEAAIVTTSLLNPTLKKFMKTGKYTLMPIEEAGGLSFHKPYLTPNTIPQGVFSSVFKPLPEQPVKTVSTLAFLAAHRNTPSERIAPILPVLYTIDLRSQAPALVGKYRLTEDKAWSLLSLHPGAQSFFNPYQGAQRFSDFMETLNRLKWVLLLLAAGIGFGWYKWANRHEDREKRLFVQDSRTVETWLKEMARIYEGQRGAKDLRVLKGYLNEAINIKSQALETRFGSRIRNENIYMTFLQEVNHLIREIEWRISLDLPGAEIRRVK